MTAMELSREVLPVGASCGEERAERHDRQSANCPDSCELITEVACKQDVCWLTPMSTLRLLHTPAVLGPSDEGTAVARSHLSKKG